MNVLYLGDEKLNTRQFFAGTESVQVFERRVADFEPLLSALEGDPEIDVTHLSGPEIIDGVPDSAAALERYDAVVLSDLSRDTLLPHFAPGAVPGPNRVRIVAEYVESGGGLVYCGGWMSFQGYRGIGNWHGTPVAESLPVAVRSVFDDRAERPEGADVSVVDADHPVTRGLDWETFPPVYGYNETNGVREAGTPLAEVDGDPLLAVSAHGDGRVLAYTSDPGPKWGLGFVEWDGYAPFWRGAVEWVAGSR